MTVSLNQLEKAHAALQRAIAVHDRVLTGSDIDLIETTRSAHLQPAHCAGGSRKSPLVRRRLRPIDQPAESAV